MKKTDLERLKESKISSAMAQAVTPGRFGREAASQLSRREQRKIDQAQGLIPFAVKLHSELIERLHDLAQSRGIGLNELSEELLEKGLGTHQSAGQANPVRPEPVVPTPPAPIATPAPAPAPVQVAKAKPVPAAKKAPEPKKAPAAKKAPVVKKPAAKAPAAKAKKKPVAAKPKKR
jgi:outer membrane biosynthesis protein TonB